MPGKKRVLSSSRARRARGTDQTIDDLAAEVNKAYGEGTMVRASEARGLERKQLTTGSLAFDLALGGGIPEGEWTELIGKESSGKTTVAFNTLAAAQADNPEYTCLWVASESYDANRAAQMGVDNDRVWLFEDTVMELAYATILDHIVRRAVDMVVIDSYPNLQPDAEDEAGIEGMQPATGARLTSKFLRACARVSKRDLRNGDRPVTGIFINQWRCLDKSTNIWTQRGLLQAGEVRAGDRVLSPFGRFVSVEQTADSGVLDGVVVKSHHAPALRLSNNHRQPVVHGADTVEVLAKDITPGMWLQQKSEMGFCREQGCVSEDLLLDAALAGAYFADGCVTHRRMCFTEVSRERYSVVKDLMVRRFGKENHGTHLISVGKVGVAWVDSHGLAHDSKHKEVPDWVRTGPREVIVEFLRHASFDTHKFELNRFYWTFDADAQARQFRSLLAGLGIYSSVVRSSIGEMRYLSLTGGDAARFRDEVGFVEPAKTDRSFHFAVGTSGARGVYDVVPAELGHKLWLMGAPVRGRSSSPHYGALSMCLHKGLNMSRERLVENLRWVVRNATGDLVGEAQGWLDVLSTTRFTEITSVDPCLVDAVDLQVAGELFVAEGFVTHNSKIGLVFGDPRVTPGGKHKDYYMWLRVDITRSGWIEGDKDKNEGMLGQQIQVVAMKNKQAPPRDTGQTDFYFRGPLAGQYDTAAELRTLGKMYDVIEGTGRMRYGSMSFAGKQVFDEAVRADPALAAEIRAAIVAKALGTPDIHKPTVVPRRKVAQGSGRRTSGG